uniref:Uncharacterized protein n=1 Tax=Anguilla anguilla TaxID=7936 RepID=A0A0E9TI60_ANGAN
MLCLNWNLLLIYQHSHCLLSWKV